MKVKERERGKARNRYKEAKKFESHLFVIKLPTTKCSIGQKVWLEIIFQNKKIPGGVTPKMNVLEELKLFLFYHLRLPALIKKILIFLTGAVYLKLKFYQCI